MNTKKVDKVVLLLIFLSLIVGVFTIYQRVAVEKEYKSAEIVLDYVEMEKFSDVSHKDLGYWLSNFKEYGAQSVAVSEETINTLIEDGKYLRAEIVSELIKNYEWENNYSYEIVSKIKDGSIDSNDAVITTLDKNLFNYIVSGLNQRYSDEFFDTFDVAGAFYIILHGTEDDTYYGSLESVVNIQGKGVYEKKEILDSRLFNIGINYDEDKINIIKESGLDVILRPINYPENNAKLVDAYKSANEKFNIEPRLYILMGKEILGYPDNEEKLLDYLVENNISSVLIESSNQREHLEIEGLDELVEKSKYNAVRAFTMWDYIRQRYEFYNYDGAQEIENTMFRAITERNIRVIYFKPFFEEIGSLKYMTKEAEYERTFESLKNRLGEHDITLGKTEPIQEFHIGAKRLAVLAFGITLAGVYLFIKMFKIKSKYANYLYISALPAALVPMVMRNVAEKGFALLAAVIFSGLAIYYFMMKIKYIYTSQRNFTNIQMMVRSTLILTLSICISLAGAVFLVAMLSDVKYLLEMDIFRGVKIAQILPFLIFIIMYLIYFMNKDNEDSFKGICNTALTILNKDIKIYYAIIAGIIGIIGYIYISRTGHETELQPSNIEMIARNFMEYVLLARPRTKEFLIAFPAIFAAVFAANKKSEFFTGIFMLGGAVGTSSVINTFSHLRTPIYLSLARTVIALGLGIIIGCIAIIILNLIYLAFIKLQERIK